MALAPLAYVLYTRVMRHNPSNPDWIDRDRFILSAGHASMLLYSMLYLTGYPLTLEDIENFRQVGSPTAGHPERKYSPGIEATTGPLGQGISMSVGIALGERMLAARFNEAGHDVVGHYTFTIASDGDIQEGVASEASSLAGHLGLGRLIAFFDNNHIQLASPTSAVISEDVAEALRGVRVARRERRRGPVAGHARDRDTRGDGGRGPPVADHGPLPYRLRQPAQAGHIGRARLAARRGRGAADQGGVRLGPGQALLRARGRVGALPRVLRARPRVRGRVAGAIRRLPTGAPRPGGVARDDQRRRDAGGLGCGRSALRPKREADRHAQGLGAGDPVGGQVGSASDRRLGRPRHLQQHRHQGRGRRREGRLRGPKHPLRRARARHGGDRQRARAARLPGLRRYFPHVLGLHARGGPAVGPDEAAVDLGLHARLDRARRGRPDAPAD